MTTSPQRSPRIGRSPRQGRPGSPSRRIKSTSTTAGDAAGSAATAGEIASADGRLTMLDESGAVIQVTPAAVVESVRYMLGRLRLGDGVDFPERLGLTSALSGEGTTFLCRAIGMVLANDAARRVCIVDLNWSSPSDWPDDEGLQAGIADVLRGTTDIEHAVVATGNPGLSVLRAGETTPVERPALAHSPELEKALVELTESFDHLLLDLPAVHASSDTLTLAESSAAVALVVNQGVTTDDQVRAALEELSGIPLLGVILNRSSSKVPRCHPPSPPRPVTKR